jgi:hypothetical protein
MFQPRFRSVTTHTPDPAAQLALPRGLDCAVGFVLLDGFAGLQHSAHRHQAVSDEPPQRD